MNSDIKIKPKRLGDEAYETISRWIIEGRFLPGAHLNEVGLCSALGISRTPVREALFKLEQQGFVASAPNRGFFVSAPNKEITANLYPILAALEALALKTAPHFSEKPTAKLKMIHRDMKAAKSSPGLFFQLDLDFHEALTEPCPNQPLRDQLEVLYRQLRRYGGGKSGGYHSGYGAVIGALSAGDNARAAALIEQLWLKK